MFLHGKQVPRTIIVHCAATQAQEIESSETSAGLYQNNYFGLTFHFPEDWQTAARPTLDSMDASGEGWTGRVFRCGLVVNNSVLRASC
jgi:hypothetical protein